MQRIRVTPRCCKLSPIEIKRKFLPCSNLKYEDTTQRHAQEMRLDTTKLLNGMLVFAYLHLSLLSFRDKKKLSSYRLTLQLTCQLNQTKKNGYT